MVSVFLIASTVVWDSPDYFPYFCSAVGSAFHKASCHTASPTLFFPFFLPGFLAWVWQLCDNHSSSSLFSSGICVGGQSWCTENSSLNSTNSWNSPKAFPPAINFSFTQQIHSKMHTHFTRKKLWLIFQTKRCLGVTPGEIWLLGFRAAPRGLETKAGISGAGAWWPSMSPAECWCSRRQSMLPQGIAAVLARETRDSAGRAKPVSCFWGDSLGEVHPSNWGVGRISLSASSACDSASPHAREYTLSISLFKSLSCCLLVCGLQLNTVVKNQYLHGTASEGRVSLEFPNGQPQQSCQGTRETKSDSLSQAQEIWKQISQKTTSLGTTFLWWSS